MFHITTLLDQYGYSILFASLLLELIALPIPTEVLMMYSGFLVYEGKLSWIFAVLSAFFGSSAGITLAFLIGNKLGYPFFHKHGHKVHMGPEQLDKTSKWFGKYGNKLLFIAYFIPGVRHITGYFSGITKIRYLPFATRAYTGAFLWVFTFISLGKVLGPKWETFHTTISKYLIIFAIIVAVILVAFYVYRKYKRQNMNYITNIMNKALNTFHSLGRVRIFVGIIGVVFIILFSFMIGLIQDLLAHEFNDFDSIAIMLVQLIFSTECWTTWMKLFNSFASIQILILIVVVTLLLILIKSRYRKLESGFLIFVCLGGEILEEAIRWVFHRVGPSGSITRSFPSEQSFMAVAIYGFCAYLLYHHNQKIKVRSLTCIVLLGILFINGISQVFLGIHYPSDVIAGFVFAGVWVSANIILLEINRILPKTRKRIDV